MKKFLSLALVCVGVVSTVSSMEQSLDLSRVLETCPDQIAGRLDGKTFSSLMQVCSLFQAVCNAIPVQELAINFSDAAEHKNKNLIERFIAKPDGWMFEPGIGKEIFLPQEGIGNDLIKVFKRSFGKGSQGFLGDCSIYCISQNNKIVRYFLAWQDFDKIERLNLSKLTYLSYLNVDECNGVTNTVSTKCMKHAVGFEGTTDFDTKALDGCCYWIDATAKLKWKRFALLGSSHSAESILKKFGMITTFLLAAQKSHTAVTYAILNNPTTLDFCPSDIFGIAMYGLDNGNEIKDVVAAALFERNTASSKAKK